MTEPVETGSEKSLVASARRLGGFFTRPSRLRHGILGQASGQIVQIGVRLIEVPLFLHFWGAHLYGEWLVVTAIPGMLALGDLGVSQSAVRGITTANAARREDEALEIFQSAALMTLLFSTGFAALFVALSTMKEVGSAIGLSPAVTSALPSLLGALAGYTIITMQSLLMFGILQSVGKYPLGFFLLAITRVAEFSAVALVVALGGGLIGAALAMLMAQFASFFGLVASARRFAPWMKFGIGRIRVRSIKALIKPSLAFAAFPIAQGISLQAFRVLIGGALGPAAVVIFTTHRQLARFLNIGSNFMMSVQGELGLAFGAGDLERYRRLSIRTFRALFFLGGVGFLVLLVAAPWIYVHWTAHRVAYDSVLFTVLLAAAFAEMMWRGAMAPAIATNRHEWIALAYLSAQIICLPVLFLFIHAGLRSVAVIVVTAEISMLIFVVLEFRRLIGIKVGALFKGYVRSDRLEP